MPNPNLNFLTQFHPLISNFDVHDVHLSVAPRHVKHLPVHASHVNPADPEIDVGVFVNPAAHVKQATEDRQVAHPPVQTLHVLSK